MKPALRKLRASPWWSRIVAVAILIGAAIGGTWHVLTYPWRSAILFAAVVTLMGLLVLRERFRWLKRLMDEFGRVYVWMFAWYLKIFAWFLAAFVPILLARYLADLVADLALPVAVGLLLVWLAAFLFLVRQLSSEARRRTLWLTLSRFGRATPFLYTFAVAFVAIILFGTIAFMLADNGLIAFGTDPGAPPAIAEPANAFDFFLWHLLDSIPGLDVTETLRWEEPLGYSDGRVGTLLLAFKIVVIVPSIAAVAAFWRYSREPAPS